MEDCISVKKITLYVSANARLPETIMEWSPEDTETILSVGYSAFIQAKQSVSSTNYREVVFDLEQSLSKKYEETLSASREKADKMERELQFQKERIKLMQDEEDAQVQRRMNQSKEAFDVLLESYKRERDELKSRIFHLERENDNAKLETEQRAHKEAITLVGRELESMRQMLKEKDKQIEMHKEMFEKSIAKVDNLTQKRDVASIGKIGEGQFRGLAANVFRDFEGFQLKEVYSIGGLGDFHLHFKEMTILVDSKLYTNKVNSTSREKIKRDLLNNDHIQFAWLVSMDTNIDRFDKAPFMFEWINSQKCICYINCLRGREEPGELLRSVWYCCKALQQMMTTDATERCELSVLKEREMKVRDILQKMVKSNRERDTLLTQIRQNFDKTDDYIRDLLNSETDVVVNQYYRTVVEWWNRNLENTSLEPATTIKSTLIWTQFKRDMGDQLKDMDANTFKDILCGFLGEDKVVKPKVKGGALELKGVKWRADVKIRRNE
jgi:hypothetical protein